MPSNVAGLPSTWPHSGSTNLSGSSEQALPTKTPVWTLIVVGVTLALFLILDRTGGETPLAKLLASAPSYVPLAISAVSGGVISFVLIRIAYVIWRDIDIVDLQAGVISQAANAEKRERHNANADAIAGSGVVDPRKNNRNTDEK